MPEDILIKGFNNMNISEQKKYHKKVAMKIHPDKNKHPDAN